MTKFSKSGFEIIPGKNIEDMNPDLPADDQYNAKCALCPNILTINTDIQVWLKDDDGETICQSCHQDCVDEYIKAGWKNDSGEEGNEFLK